LLALSALAALLVAGPVEGAAGKTRKVKCKAGQVTVKVGKRKTCRPFAKVFPQPKDVDMRLAYLRSVLKFDPAKKVRGKKRRRARTLQSGLGAAGKRAQKKLLKLLPKALALIDRKGGGASASRVSPDPAFASAGCGPGPASPIGHTGGASVGALGDNGGYVDAPAGGGLRVRVTFYSCGGVTNFRIPECPLANGSVDAQGKGEFRATIEVLDGSQFVSRNSSTFEDKAKVHGEVGPDAKLKFIEVEHAQEVFIVASGGIVIRGGIERKVRIDMPAGQYDPARARVRPYGDAVSDSTGASAFASTAQAAISGYRNAEARWSDFGRKPHCAEPVFSPESNTLKLKKNDEKQLTIYAKAKQDGGRATGAKWTLLNQENAQFSPTSSEDPGPTIQYRVTNAPPGGFVKLTVKFTSTAGVGEGTWTQPVEEVPTINFISGTFSRYENAFGSIYQASGSIKFERFTPAIFGGASGEYKFKEGQATMTASGSGAWPIGAPGCSLSGSTQVALGETSSVAVFGSGEDQTAPYEYYVSMGSDTGPPLPMFNVTTHGCDEDDEEFENDVFELPAVFALFSTGAEKSEDGIDYSGSKTFEEPNLTIIETWSFTGSE
jgi:hypothetical protein